MGPLLHQTHLSITALQRLLHSKYSLPSHPKRPATPHRPRELSSELVVWYYPPCHHVNGENINAKGFATFPWWGGFHLDKQKTYSRVKFDSKTLAAAERTFKSLSGKTTYHKLSVQFADSIWSFDTFAEFLAAADRGVVNVQIYGETHKWQLFVFPVFGRDSTNCIVSVAAPTREEIESVFDIFEADVERCLLPALAKPATNSKVFVGHGQDPQWRDLKDHLHEKHGYSVEAYEIGSRAGHTIRDILEEMLDSSSFALLVMTGEDETKEGNLRPRQNVVHEAGLFQGRLGFPRAIILLEEGAEEFSNIFGLQQIRFSKGKIKESFGDVLAVLKRELG